MTSTEIAEKIKKQAHRLGFILAGFTPPEKPPHYDFFLNWLSAGHHGDMAYLAAERSLDLRANPRRLLPECRSILVLGIRYPAPSQPSDELRKPLSGRVASYALGEDYHLILPARLHQLAEYIQSLTQHPLKFKAVTDSAPILERDLAQRAGLGWVGKNTCLIHPAFGSYFFLAELLLDLDVGFDAPFEKDYCGTCTRCIEACPTHCILPDRTLDAKRCISYLTIELKSEIPSDLQPHLGEWVFGCDICQMVCPWNRRAGNAPIDPLFWGDEKTSWVYLEEILRLQQDQFRSRYRHSPVQRTKLRGLGRNSAIVLGNLAEKKPQYRSEIVRVLSRTVREHPEPLVRLHALFSLARIPTPAARQVLFHQFEVEKDDKVLQSLQNILQSGL